MPEKARRREKLLSAAPLRYKTGTKTPLNTFKSSKSHNNGSLHSGFNNERKKIRHVLYFTAAKGNL